MYMQKETNNVIGFPIVQFLSVSKYENKLGNQMGTMTNDKMQILHRSKLLQCSN